MNKPHVALEVETGLRVGRVDAFGRRGGGNTQPPTVYLAVLAWAFTLFNSLRVVSYVPTMWAIQASGDSSQHSLWTWCTWLGANATMAAWLYEQDGRRVGRAVIVNIVNAAMCAVTVALIVAYRG